VLTSAGNNRKKRGMHRLSENKKCNRSRNKKTPKSKKAMIPNESSTAPVITPFVCFSGACKALNSAVLRESIKGIPEPAIVQNKPNTDAAI